MNQAGRGAGQHISARFQPGCFSLTLEGLDRPCASWCVDRYAATRITGLCRADWAARCSTPRAP